MMTPEQFSLMQTILIQALWPFIEYWVMIFMAAGIMLGIFIFFLMVARELLTRVQI